MDFNFKSDMHSSCRCSAFERVSVSMLHLLSGHEDFNSVSGSNYAILDSKSAVVWHIKSPK